MAIFGAKKRVDELEEMNQGLQDANQALREQLDRLGALDQFQIAAETVREETGPQPARDGGGAVTLRRNVDLRHNPPTAGRGNG